MSTHMKWLPMCTAPKDGTPVILLLDSDSKQTATAKFSNSFWWLAREGDYVDEDVPLGWIPIPVEP